MNINRRTEPFRYTLIEPVELELHILTINQAQVPSKPVRAVLYNISRSGCQLSLPLNINPEKNSVRIGTQLNLADEPMYLEGTMKWIREQQECFQYGIQWDKPEANSEQLSRLLRKLAGDAKILVR